MISWVNTDISLLDPKEDSATDVWIYKKTCIQRSIKNNHRESVATGSKATMERCKGIFYIFYL